MLLCRSTKLILIINCFIRLLCAFSPTLRVLRFRSFEPTVHASSDIHRILKTRLSNVRFTSKGDAGDDFFSSGDGGGYVPSGLTREQYEKIKKEERDKQKKMNFGAWGPRFSKSDRPTGDWMVVPSLWVSGFTNNPVQRDTKLSLPVEKTTTQRTRSLQFLTKTALLGFAMLDISLAITYLLHKKRGASLMVMTLFKMKRISFTVPIKALLKYTLLKFIIGSLLVNFTISLTERTMKYNRGSCKQ